MTDTAPETPTAPAVAGPFLAGTFALFDTPTGGLHLVWRENGAEQDQHLEVPALLVGMARRHAGGKGVAAGDLLKMMRGAL